MGVHKYACSSALQAFSGESDGVGGMFCLQGTVYTEDG